MKHSKEEILNALKVIQEECESNNRSCDDCPFYGSGCEVTNEIPSAWRITENKPVIWRALK